MGNNRQALKERIAKDLKSKIEIVSKTLDGLKLEASEVHDDSMQAKQDIAEAINEIIAALMARKGQLFHMVDKHSKLQLTSLQDSIQQTSVNLGNLQSIATNLDTFDAGQLNSVRVPDIPEFKNPRARNLEVNVTPDPIISDINVWGKINEMTVDDHEDDHFFEMDAEIIQLQEIENEGWKSRIGATNSLSSSSNISKKDEPFVFAAPAPAKQDYVFMDPQDAKIGKWLSQLNIKGTEKESFKFEAEPKDVTCVKKLTKKRSYEDGFCMVEDNTVTGSSHENINQWLNPRKRPFGNCSQNTQSLPQKAKTKPIEFPCLQFDSTFWMRKGGKKPRNQLPGDHSISASKIFPPKYTLPYPYWLKNQCVAK